MPRYGDEEPTWLAFFAVDPPKCCARAATVAGLVMSSSPEATWAPATAALRPVQKSRVRLVPSASAVLHRAIHKASEHVRSPCYTEGILGETSLHTVGASGPEDYSTLLFLA